MEVTRPTLIDDDFMSKPCDMGILAFATCLIVVLYICAMFTIKFSIICFNKVLIVIV